MIEGDLGEAIRFSVLLGMCSLIGACTLLFDPRAETSASVDGGDVIDAAPMVSGNTLINEGFESGIGGWEPWTLAGGVVEATREELHDGERAAKLISGESQGTQAAIHTDLPGVSSSRSDIYLQTHIFLREGFPVTGLIGILELYSQGLALQIFIGPNGALTLKNEMGDLPHEANYVMPVGEWIPLEVRLSTNAGSGHALVRVGGTDLIDEPTTFSNNTPIDSVSMGVLWQSEDKAYELFVDDVLVMDQLE